MNEYDLRRELVRIANKLDAQGLNRGTSGNLSARFGEGMLITPSGMGVEGLSEDDIVFVQMNGTARGRWQPSSEWLFHRDIYAQRPEFGCNHPYPLHRGDRAGLFAQGHPAIPLHDRAGGR